MATFNFAAVPAYHEQEPGRCYTSTVIEVLGTCFAKTRIEAKSVAEVTAHVKAFGNDVAKQHPDASFMMSVGIAKGSRKPNGFDAANSRNGLGQETWMKTIDGSNLINPGLVA